MAFTTEEIPRERWSEYLDDLSRRLDAPTVTVEIDGEDIGAQIAAEGVRLAGITYDHKDDVVVIGLDGVGGPPEEHERMVNEPTRVLVASGDAGVAAIDVEDAEGHKTIVRIEGSLSQGA
jgi:hypothetical protein